MAACRKKGKIAYMCQNYTRAISHTVVEGLLQPAASG